MIQFVVRRLLMIPVLLLIIYTITFSLLWFVPGSPLDDPDRAPTPAALEALNAKYHTDQPVKMYYSYLKELVVNQDLGVSFKQDDLSVGEIIGRALPVSLQLGLLAIIIALCIGVPAGVIGAVHKGKAWDWISMSIALTGISLPTFVTGSLLMMLFVIQLQWLSTGWGTFSQMLMPALTLSLPFAAYIARLTRMGMLDVLDSDFIRTARSKGVTEKKVVSQHALKVAFLPVLSFLGPAAAGAMTGSFVIEKVFNIPGMGVYFIQGVIDKDTFIVMGVVLVYATILICFNLLVDICYALVDPRIELE